LVDNRAAEARNRGKSGFDWKRAVPFVVMHLACLAVLWVGWSPVAAAVGIGFYLLRAFFVTGFYHRYFSHRTFHTSRQAQFVFAVLGNTATQRGPLWWAAHHRQHHKTSDREGDPHSPLPPESFWSGHIGWLLQAENFPTRMSLVPDLARYPELRWLDRFDIVVPLLYAASMYGLGALLKLLVPSWGTNGPQMLVWGFFISTVILFHVTFLVNSAAHLIGGRRYKTPDGSRNSWIVAILTLGEGWHNNHHHYPAATSQGHYWWELDVTYYLLRCLAWTGVIWDLNPVPHHTLERDRVDRQIAA